MSVATALSTFRTEPWKYNCAQTVCAAFGKNELIEKMGICGGGRAPEGICGALYGALHVEPGHRDRIISLFEGELGATKCLDLKKRHKADCRDCVRTAATILEELRG